MSRKRRAYESGHKPKFLVIVDDTPECDRAVRFAARRIARIGGRLLMLRVIQTADMDQQWLGVADLMRAEAHEAAAATLEHYAREVRSLAGIEPECVVREGEKAPEIISLIDEDEDIAVLVLAAGTGSEGPGPLVSTLAGKASGTFPIPLAIVPGHLADDEIDALA
ncbi:MAG: universal stress protein [Bacteroidales bacterium]|nr:universal stress protein [Bacteroidales bacterium]